MSKSSCEAAESTESAILRMARGEQFTGTFLWADSKMVERHGDRKMERIEYSRMVKLCGVEREEVERNIAQILEQLRLKAEKKQEEQEAGTEGKDKENSIEAEGRIRELPKVSINSLPGEIHVKVSALGTDEKEARKAVKPVVRELKARLGDAVYSTEEDTTLEQAAVELLMANGLTVTCAESCTGGMLSARLINVAGVSECYKCGFITYSNKAKRKLLGVKKGTLHKYGAVSAQTAEEMARGAALRFQSDVAVSVTGIAGPDGGTEEKPVGLVYIGCCVKGQVMVKECHFEGDRQEVRAQSVTEALVLMRSCILAVCGQDKA